MNTLLFAFLLVASFGEIEIVENKEKINQIRQGRYDALREQGVSADQADKWTRVGVIAQDAYWIWMRDPVIWPSGREGLYNRILFRSSIEGKKAAAILPVTKEGQVGLILTFRHATREWELELPRGGTNDTEPLAAAKTELNEEMGLQSEEWTLLGEMTPDTGIINHVVPVYLARVEKPVTHQELSEAISATYYLSMEQVNQGLIQGYLDVPFEGEKKRAFLRDPFLTYALYLAKIKHKI